MRYARTRSLAIASVLIFNFALLTVAQVDTRPSGNNRSVSQTTNPAASAPGISYTVSMPRPNTHLLEVEMRLVQPSAAASPRAVDLVMPVWTPGSYLVREYARHVQDFAAADAGGRQLPWRKVNKNTWRVEVGGAREWRANYGVYANELTVRTNELNERHAFWNNAALLMYVDGFLNSPATVRVAPANANWKIATGLPVVAGSPNTFRAENFDVLYDSPFLAAAFQTLEFQVRGTPHRIHIDGEGNHDPERVRTDTQKIAEATVALMGDVPFTDYTFMLMLHPTASGGLEHLNSTALIFPRYNFRPDSSYRNFLTLVAHEYFHVWNVKRIRPDALGPFDYTGENYTRLLWVAEGLTSYYENLLVRRAGLMTDKDFLETWAKEFQTLQGTPGRLEMSVEEASFDAWIKYYRADENTVNSSVSYYDKGGIVGLLLDLEIRRRSGGARSLDDVMRALYNEYAKRNRNYTPEDFQRAAEQAAGASLDDFFRRYVRGREELDYDAALAAAGLRLDTATASGSAPAVERAYIGHTLARDGEQVLGADVSAGTLVVRTVPAGTPGYEQGLSVGDQIVALDGVRVTRESLDKRLEEKRPGDSVRLTVFRNDDLRTLDIRLGGKSNATYRIVPVQNPTEQQMKIYQDWLGAPFPKGS